MRNSSVCLLKATERANIKFGTSDLHSGVSVTRGFVTSC